MKNYTKYLVLPALLLVFPVLAFGADFRTGQQPSIGASEKISENIYIAGGTVLSAGSIEKDLMVAGGTAVLSGPVLGDLFVAGGNVTVLNQIGGDLRAVGGNVVMTGDVLGDVVVAGGQIMLSGKVIGGDVAVAGGTVRLDSEVKGDMKIAGGEIYLNAPIAGNVNIKAEKVTLGPKADIKGNLKYQAVKPVTIEEGGKVQGETVFTEIKGLNRNDKDAKKLMLGFLTFIFVAKFLMLLTGALVIGLVFRKYSKELVEKGAHNPLKELGRGVVTMIVLPILSIILMATIIGVPLGMLGLLSFVMLMVYACIVTPVFLGSVVHKWISRKQDYTVNWKTILLGVVVYCLLGLIPFLGWIAICASTAITLGAALSIKWQVAREWR